MAGSQATPMLYARPGLLGLTLALFWAATLYVSYERLLWTPKPLPDEGTPASAFSEERALRHVRHLASKIGDRQVSTQGLVEATEYMLQQARLLEQAAKGRADIVVEALKETVSGAVAMDFVGINFTNAYRHLDNVVLTIRPADAPPGAKAVLVAAHYDSAVCSQGAADDASMSGVMLELARALIHRPGAPPAPLVFLWTGGEEPVSPAAHGWASSSPLYSTLGAFINLEAMGGGGLPIVFQHTGAWVLDAFAKGAPHVRGTRIAQDIFDLQLIPADSDFRMFSAAHYGSLPGLDIAYIMDSPAYHTYLDSPERIRPGIVQEMGESLSGGLMSVAATLAARQAAAAAAPAAPPDAAAAAERAQALERAVYFDVLGYFMVVYGDSAARALHNAPLALLLATPLLGVPKGVTLLGSYGGMFAAAGRMLLSVVLAVALPVGLGVARVLLLGKPMIWFAHQWVGHAIFVPISLCGALLPWARTAERMEAAGPLGGGHVMRTQLLGCGLTAAVIGAALTAAGLKGNAFIFAMNGVVALVVAGLMGTRRLKTPALLAALAASAVPVAAGASVVLVFSLVMMERMSTTGFVSVVLGDIVVGALCGAAALATTCGCWLPVMAYCIPKGSRKAVYGGLLLASLAAAAWATHSLQPYSPYRPKRAVVNHLVILQQQQQQAAAAAAQQQGGVAVVREAIAFGILDSNPLAPEMTPQLQALVSSGYNNSEVRPFQGIFPLDAMVQSELLELSGPLSKGADEPALVSQLPYVELVSRELLPPAAAAGAAPGGTSSASGSVLRLHLRLFTEKACWGVLNVTGPLSGWSFTRRLAPSHVCKSCGQARQHVLRFVTQNPDPFWHFWLDVPAPLPAAPAGPAAQQREQPSSAAAPAAVAAAGIRVEMTVMYLNRTQPLLATLRQLPAYMIETWMSTAYQAAFEF